MHDEYKTINGWVRESYYRAVANGEWNGPFGDLQDAPTQDHALNKLALIHPHIRAAVLHCLDENYGMSTADSDRLTGLPIDLAKICILVFDLAGALNIDLQHAVAAQSAYNEKLLQESDHSGSTEKP
jgi:hypothetical protein